MVNQILSSTIIILAQAQASFGWIPRSSLTSCNKSIRNNGVDASSSTGSRQRVVLSANNINDDSILDDDDDSVNKGHDDRKAEPLFVDEVDHRQLSDFVSRLEAIYDIDTDLHTGDSKVGPINSSVESQRLLKEGDRVVLGDWMDWDEGPCYGDSCGDEFDQCDIPEEYKVAAPKVDVMSFLGIRRAEPLQVQRDWD